MKPHHLDSSILIPYIAALLGTREQKRHAANRRALHFVTHCRAHIRICAATLAETLRHYREREDVREYLDSHFMAPLPLLPRHARRWARLQNRSGRVMGDNDAWVAALAADDGGVVVGHDKNAFKDRPEVDYIDFMA
jgi:predicted nucleic acid-binding protein